MSPLHLIEYLYHSAVCNHEIDLNLRSMEKKESYNIKINNFNIQETKYLTNNLEKAKNITPEKWVQQLMKLIK